MVNDFVGYDDMKKEGFTDFGKTNYVPQKYRVQSKIEKQLKNKFPKCPKPFPECGDIFDEENIHNDCKSCPYFK